MGILDLFRRDEPLVERREPLIHAQSSPTFLSLNDPRLIEFLRLGDVTATGMTINVERALKNPAMFRAVTLISYAIGMLPLQLIVEGTKKKATDHSLYKVLHRRPNGWQSAFDFRVLMQQQVLTKGNAYALVLRSFNLKAGKKTVSQLIPLDPDRVEVKQRNDWSVFYRYTPKTGGYRDFEAGDIFHLRGFSLDGLRGVSLVRQAAEAIALALTADLAAGRMFQNGVLGGSVFQHPQLLSPEAHQRLTNSLAEKESAENAGKSLILEEGMTQTDFKLTSRDAELAAIKKLQVEEIGRITGVPRPLLMVDETSWGSGIYALGQFFVQYALGPWFEAWQQAGERVLLDDADQETLSIKFNAGALLRGSIVEQGEFFGKALGSGGSKPFMTQNEVRDLLDMPSFDEDGANDLGQGMMSRAEALSDNPTKTVAADPAPKKIEDDENDDEE